MPGTAFPAPIPAMRKCGGAIHARDIRDAKRGVARGCSPGTRPMPPPPRAETGDNAAPRRHDQRRASGRREKVFSQRKVAQLNVRLIEIDPPIWRRLLVPPDWTLAKLHRVLQAAFGWTDAHLHEFHIGGLRYGDPDLLNDGFDGPRVFDYAEVRLLDFLGQPEAVFVYVYDFGDNWQHEIRIEAWPEVEAAPKQAQCLDGARARPPEDVGGPWSYGDFQEAIRDPEHDDHASNLRWAGGHFDPEWFDLEVINKDLRNAMRSNAARRLHQPKPKKG
jgi:hypothetical protein